MSNNEELIMNLELSKLQFNLWRDQVSSMYEGHYKSEDDEIIDLYTNFHKKGFGESEIKDILDNTKIQKSLDL